MHYLNQYIRVLYFAVNETYNDINVCKEVGHVYNLFFHD